MLNGVELNNKETKAISVEIGFTTSTHLFKMNNTFDKLNKFIAISSSSF